MEEEVLLVSPSFKESTGGVQRLMQEIVRHSSFSFRVLTEDFVDEEGFERMNIKGVSGVLKVNKYIWNNKNDIDVVYVSTGRRLHLLLLPIILGIGAICHAHGRDLYLSRSTIKEIVQEIIISFVRRMRARFIAVSEWTKTKLVRMGVNSDRVHVVPNGVSVDRFRDGDGEEIRNKYGIDEDKFLLVTVARIDPRKGHRLVIESLKEIDNCVYLVVGTGEYEGELKRIAKENGVSDRVKFAGFVPDGELPDVYHACDLFVMPSEHLEGTNNVEGFGISFLEANAAGKAVIGTRTGGIPTAIKHKKNGYLCDPDKESVLNAINEVKNNHEIRNQLEENAIWWAEEHDWSKIVNRIDKIISMEMNI